MPLPKITQPIFKIELPSTKEMISIRPMLVKEEKILLIAKESADQFDIYTAVKQVVNNCMVDYPNFDRLALFDVEFLFLKIRAISISNILRLEFKDPEDNQDKVDKTYGFEINLDEIKLTEPKAKNVFDFKNGPDTIEIVLKYPSQKLYDDKSLIGSGSAVEVLDRLKKAVIDKVKVNGVPQSYDEDALKEWLDGIPLEAANHINEYIVGLPQFHHEIKYTNSRGNERSIVLTKLEDFFTLR